MLSFLKLSTVIPDVREVKVAGETFKLKRFTLKQHKESRNCAGFFLELITKLEGRQLGMKEMLELLSVSAEPAIILASVTAEKPMEWAEQLGPEDIIPLLMACAEVNRDFFAKAFLPAIPGWRKRLNQLLKKA